MVARLTALGALLAVVLAVAPAPARTWPTGAGAGTVQVSETISRYGSGATFTARGLLAIGAATYRGTFTAAASLGPFGPPTATLSGSAGGHSLTGSCTVAGIAPPAVGGGIAEIDTFRCDASIDAAQTSRLTVRFALVGVPPPAPCGAPASSCSYDYRGTFVAG